MFDLRNAVWPKSTDWHVNRRISWGQWTFGFGEQLELGPLLGAQQFSRHSEWVNECHKWYQVIKVMALFVFIGCRVGHWEIHWQKIIRSKVRVWLPFPRTPSHRMSPWGSLPKANTARDTEQLGCSGWIFVLCTDYWTHFTNQKARWNLHHASCKFEMFVAGSFDMNGHESWVISDLFMLLS